MILSNPVIDKDIYDFSAVTGFRCKVCNFRTTDEPTLHSHLTAHKDYLHSCHICSFVTDTIFCWSHHMRIEHGYRPSQLFEMDVHAKPHFSRFDYKFPDRCSHLNYGTHVRDNDTLDPLLNISDSIHLLSNFVGETSVASLNTSPPPLNAKRPRSPVVPDYSRCHKIPRQSHEAHNVLGFGMQSQSNAFSSAIHQPQVSQKKDEMLEHFSMEE